VAAHEEGMAMASEVLASVSRGAAEQIAEDAGLSLKQVEDLQRFFLMFMMLRLTPPRNFCGRLRGLALAHGPAWR
jgi:hypothetical protein